MTTVIEVEREELEDWLKSKGWNKNTNRDTSRFLWELPKGQFSRTSCSSLGSAIDYQLKIDEEGKI